MTVAETVDVNDLVSSTSPVSAGELEQIEAVISSRASEVRRSVNSLETQAAASGPQKQRIGILQYYLSNHRRAAELLADISGDPVAAECHARALVALERYEEAAERFQDAIDAGGDRVGLTLLKAGAVRAGGDVDAAEKMLRSVASEAASRADYSFQMGCVLADRGDTFGAIEYFERAVDMDPHHSRALFWLANENSLRGNDDDAIRYYEQSLSKPPYYIGALLNLGLMYEDREQYSAAAFCFNRVLDQNPNHPRARLYLKDIEATHDMYYDEDSARHEARMQQLLSRPVTDFELSVRSRNCLQGMNIFTLGDLTEVSEQELLAGKNFGETSLQEIRQMLEAHGLRIGQNLHKVHSHKAAMEIQNLSPAEQAKLNQPVSDLNLSVRSRKCMVRLGINTVGQLIQRTADELLASRNFGVTSLNEIRSKLAEFNLRLRND